MRFFKILFSRTTIVLLIILLQLALSLFLIYSVNYYFKWVQVISYILGIIVFLTIVNRKTTAESKLPWLTLVLIFPLFGVVIYVMFSRVNVSRKHLKRYAFMQENSDKFISQSAKNTDKISEKMGNDYGKSYAINIQSKFPAYADTKTTYFPMGEDFYASLISDLKTAKEFIFMEYFIIEKGEMWNGILDILREKAISGVDVRVIYDDIGCMGLVKNNYYKTLRKYGIKCCKFNKFSPDVSIVHNYRDHRKITVIDGTIGYTGGINIADEYINKKVKFGKWKDTAVKLTGNAVNSLTLMFLQSYSIMNNSTEDIQKFFKQSESYEGFGIVQPFGSGPSAFYKHNVAENAILNIINQANDYVYISTPYLVCDYTLLTAIKQASLRGVDVKILTPAVPDKKIVWYLTRYSYAELIDAGVKVYQYTPGFNHGKVILADGNSAIVGTINLDYRSLVHHFEDGVFMYKTPCLKDIYNDFINTFAESDLQNERTAKLGFFKKITCAVIKIFSPMI